MTKPSFTASEARGLGRSAARRAQNPDEDLEQLWLADVSKYPALRPRWDDYAWGYWDEVIAIDYPDFYPDFDGTARNPQEGFREEHLRLRREAGDRVGRVVRAFHAASAMDSTAIRGKGYGGRPTMAIMSGELVDKSDGAYRVTFFGMDGPHGHVTKKTQADIAQEVARVLDEPPIEPMSEAEVMAWTSTPEFELGSRVVAFVQAENTLRYYAQRAKRSDWAQKIIAHANEVGTADGKYPRGMIDTIEAGTKLLTDAMRELPAPNSRYRPNPAWVTSALASSYETLEAKVPPQWLPKLDKVKARDGLNRSRLVAEMPELGCGAYGCVLDTLDADVVLKVTTDPTEAQFAAELADSLVADICVEYKMVVRLAKERNGLPIFLLWREAATKVGGLEPHPGIDAQHEVAQAVYAQLFKNGKASPKLLEQWRDALYVMGEDKRLAQLAAGLLKIYEEQGIFFGDLHAGNLGLVTRGRTKSWLITDPGHIAVVAE